jgi:TolB-like protein/Flp pilus assembly protein TadD
MSDVFISYKAEDRRRIEVLVQALQADGFTVWWDEHIGAGDEWSQTIERQLDSARSVVVIWSKRSIGPEGRFVREEARRAQRRGCYVPVLLDAVDPPLGFAENQAILLRGWHGNRADARYQAVLAAIRRLVPSGAASDSPPQQGGTDRRALIVAGAAVAVATAGVGGWALLKPSSAGASSESIAVLPFENLSGDPGQAYFSDGIAEEIRSALAGVAGLTVISRSSSEAVRSDDATTAARKLGVQNILTGSVRQSRSTIRIGAELVDGKTGADRWSQEYNRAPGDAIKIQTDIAENVAAALRYQLLPSVRRALTAGGTSNPLAQDRYLKGLALAHGDDESLRRGLALFDAAIAIDPDYADAFAAKAEALTLVAYNAPTDAGTRAALADALTAARTAVRLAPSRANTQSTFGVVLESLTNFQGTAQSFDKALHLGADAETLRRVAVFRAVSGAGAEALGLIDRARQLDPLDPLIQGDRGIVLYYLRRYPEAIAALRDFLRERPDSPQHRSHLTFALILTGKLDEAETELSKITVNWVRLTDEALLATRRADRARADRALAGLVAMHADLLAYQFAQIHAQQGQANEAIASLRKAILIRDSGLRQLPTDPFLDPLRGDPRFAALVQKINFPAA